MNIYSLEEFESHINNEIKYSDVRIFRFINIKNIALWLKIKSFLSLKCSKEIKLSSFCADQDLTPVIGRMYAEIKKIKENTLLLPLSEHLRLDNSRKLEIIEGIIAIEYIQDIYSSKAHLYIPMYQMEDTLKEVLNKDSRLQKNIIFIENGVKDDYSLAVLSKKIESALFKKNFIHGYKNYLKYWEENPSKSITLYTDNAEAFKNNIFRDNIKILTSSFDVINYYNLVPYKIDESFGDDWLWADLLKKIKIQNKSSSTKNLSMLFFETPNITSNQLLSEWNESGDFKKWLIWLWLKIEDNIGYLDDVIKKSNNYKSLIQDLYCNIFDYSVDDSYLYKSIYLERKRLIKIVGIDEPPLEFWQKLGRVTNNKKVFYLTDSTSKEREQIICFIEKTNINNTLSEFLEQAYPNLSAYLNQYVFNEKEFTDYFDKYKHQKIENHFSEEFIKEVSDIAKEKGSWWELRPRKELVDIAYNDEAYIYWVDALGVEYLSLIEYILESKYKDTHYYIEIGYANIPTITELNKGFIEGRNYECYRELDTLKHKGDYPYCIEKELKLVEQAVKKAIQKLESYKKVIITSDHGASRGAILCKGDSKKAEETAKVERFGRYCIDDINSYEKTYEGCIDKDNYHIFANYDRFAISGNEKSEIHGGATLEEVLVPVIVLWRIPFEAKVVITPLKNEIKLKPGIILKIKFKIDQDYDELSAIVNSQRYVCKKEEDYWYFEPKVSKEENYTAKIQSKGIVGEFTYRIIKGLGDSEKFDI